MRWALIIALTACPASAEPLFEDRSSAMPNHVYDGGWEHFVGGGVAVMDCNGDTLPDIYAAGGSNPAALFVNTGDFTFAVGTTPGLTGVTGAYPIDMNGDTFVDLFVMRVGENIVLEGNGRCGFTDTTDRYAIPAADKWTTAFTAWWQDDGRPWLAIGNYVDRFDPDGPFGACDTHQILQPVITEMHVWNRDLSAHHNRFIPSYDAATLSPGFCTLSMLAGPDARGRMTLRISNDRHYYVRDGYEQMWDIADQRFLTEADGWSGPSLWGMGIASRDLTGDGRDEVMLTSMGDQLLQLAQADGTYTAAPFDIGTYAQRPHTGGDGRPSTGWHAEFGDVDNDGRPDLFIAKGNVDQMPGMAMDDPNNLLVQQPDGTFTETAAEAGIATLDRSRGAAFADFDGDGRLDLVVINRRAPMELYRNITPDTGNWLSIDLRQAGGNSHAIGSRITVETTDITQTRHLSIGGGHAGGQLLPLHFGLGTATEARITILWPNGMTTQLTNAANQALVITRD